MSTSRAHDNYSADEINALRGIFALYDPEKSGAISASELEVCGVLRSDHHCGMIERNDSEGTDTFGPHTGEGGCGRKEWSGVAVCVPGVVVWCLASVGGSVSKAGVVRSVWCVCVCVYVYGCVGID